MKFFYDLLPLIIFLVTYKFYDLFVATAVLIGTVMLQVGVTLLRGKRPDMMQLVTLGMVVVLGGATLFFKNEMFIKWKPTAVYWVLGCIFAGSEFVTRKNLVKALLEKTLTLPEKAWSTLNISWYSFFFAMGILNLIVVYSFNTDIWVKFKVFGTLILTLVFVVLQGIYVSRFNVEHK